MVMMVEKLCTVVEDVYPSSADVTTVGGVTTWEDVCLLSADVTTVGYIHYLINFSTYLYYSSLTPYLIAYLFHDHLLCKLSGKSDTEPK